MMCNLMKFHFYKLVENNIPKLFLIIQKLLIMIELEDFLNH